MTIQLLRTSTFLRASALLVGALVLFSVATAHADEGGPDLKSYYSPLVGQPFFILTDTQYGSDSDALLRVEVPAGGRWALEAYGGIDIALYRVPDPLKFLKLQKNLHRVEVAARPRPEGVANTLGYLWDNAWKKSRFAWRDLFSAEARISVTKPAPALKSHPDLLKGTEFREFKRFDPLAGFETVTQFRYPLWEAKPIEPPKGVKLEGSSSDFISPTEGNVRVPLGRLKPGLYLVEAMIAQHRALTLLFVSDTVAVTKIASGALTVWTAHRARGTPVVGTRLLWTDGTGTLASADTDEQGLATLTHVSPETTYLLGLDPHGGVFVSENFYYDSEIHDTKLYAVTDRPLYRAGDLVQIKLFGREFQAANRSKPPEAAEVGIHVTDPNGTPILNTRISLNPDSGADTAFHLPENATAGGYDIRLEYRGAQYGAAFRVAEYVKPHFEVELRPDSPTFKTGEPVSGTLKLSYPDGTPVKEARVELGLRAQALTMVEGELRYSGLFPIELSNQLLRSDDKGEAKFTLPPAKEPSRLILTALATDGAAFRVRTTRELLVERALSTYQLVGNRQFSALGERVDFRIEPVGEAKEPPARWEMVRLEDQSRSSGDLNDASVWTPAFTRPGSYSLMLRDKGGAILAATSHWVSGEGVGVAQGSIEILTDKPRYRPGETAELLISFPGPVDEALLTLERDRVEASAILSRAKDWASAERLASNQWRVRVPVVEEYGPNVSFSVAFVKDGDYVFQNAGLVVEPPRLTLAIRPDRELVEPGETVTVDIDVALKGKPAEAVLAVSVVDEMIYALQSEIAPSLTDFLQHPRRNNVRTDASLSFIGYDVAADYSAQAAQNPPARHQANQRGIKVLERPRRDDTDTAAWLPALRTDGKGHARFSFRMPDALSRWRITIRALGSGEVDGVPGQRTAFVRSDKALYLKWTSPRWLRVGDEPIAALALFNNTPGVRNAEVKLTLAEKGESQRIDLLPGVNYLRFPLPASEEKQPVRVEVIEEGKTVDALETTVTVQPAGWRGPRQLLLPLATAATPLKLPPDASRFRLGLADEGLAQFQRVADDLIEYPWGCVEQTASRLIPLAIANRVLAPSAGKSDRLWQRLYDQRLRLIAMAGPDAIFGWWGDGTGGDALMTAYAYYADWYAAQTLGIELLANHWSQVLTAYQRMGEQSPLLHRALALWLAQEIGLPVRTQTEGLMEALASHTGEATDSKESIGPAVSPLLAMPDGPIGLAYARVLTAVVAAGAQLPLPPVFDASLAPSWEQLRTYGSPSAKALLFLAGRGEGLDTTDILAGIRSEMPTLDRSLTLAWTRKALGELPSHAVLPKPQGEWLEGKTLTGSSEWRWPEGKPLPSAVNLDATPSMKLTAVVRYEGSDDPVSLLPIQIERHLFRLERTENGYKRTQVNLEEGLSAQELYLDEIRLDPEGQFRYGLVEAALPPGAEIEPSTWGVKILEGNEATALDRSRAHLRQGSYGVAVEPLAGPVVFRHLLRVSQGGRFVLPPARFYRMYQPEEKALADEGRSSTWVVR